MALLGGSIGQVFYQRASRAAIDGTLPELVLGTVRRLLVIAAFPFLALAVVGPDLFTLVFGKEWVTAGHFLQFLSPLLFFVFLSSPISTLISVLGAHKVGLSFNLALLLTRCVSLVAGGIYGDVFVALWLYSLSGTILRAWFSAFLIA